MAIAAGIVVNLAMPTLAGQDVSTHPFSLAVGDMT
jgi:hypothetical protein